VNDLSGAGVFDVERASGDDCFSAVSRCTPFEATGGEKSTWNASPGAFFCGPGFANGDDIRWSMVAILTRQRLLPLYQPTNLSIFQQ
jgi:hypothetical protein